MKIAVCYFGNTGGKIGSFGAGGLLDPTNVLKKNDSIFRGEGLEIDYFVHSWSEEYEDIIKSTLNPKSFIFENYNKKIIKPFESFGLRNFNSYLNNCLSFDTKTKMENLLNASQFRWYSNSKCLKLLGDYSKNNNLTYDWVIQTRLDLIFFNKFDFNKLDKQLFYVPVRKNDRENALEDVFFVSDYKNAMIFANIFEERTNYSFLPPYALKEFLADKKIRFIEYKKLNSDYNLVRNIELDFITKVKLKLIKVLSKLIYYLNNLINKISN